MSRKKQQFLDAGDDPLTLAMKMQLYLRGYTLSSFSRIFNYPPQSVKVVGRQFVARGVVPSSAAFRAIYDDLQAVLQLPVIRGSGLYPDLASAAQISDPARIREDYQTKT